jgi:hypothetical protein
MRKSYASIRSCDLGLHTPGRVRGDTPKNPLRKICTAGSVRGETLTGSPLLGALAPLRRSAGQQFLLAPECRAHLEFGNCPPEAGIIKLPERTLEFLRRKNS